MDSLLYENVIIHEITNEKIRINEFTQLTFNRYNQIIDLNKKPIKNLND